MKYASRVGKAIDKFVEKDQEKNPITKSGYLERMEKILTPKVVARMKRAEEKRFKKITSLLEDEGEEFLENVRDWVQQYLDECYQNAD